MNFLYAAYTATWIVHIAYLGVLVRRYQHLRNEIEALKTKKST
jgi:CcmD family protein